RLDCIENSLAVTDPFGFVENTGDKHSADSLVAGGWANVETFYLTAISSGSTKGDATNRIVDIEGQEQGTPWWRRGTGKALEFLLEVLEAEVEAELSRVFAEELADERDFVRHKGRADELLHL